MPALIVRVKSTVQVSIVVRYCSENDLPFTVRSGGHDHEGESVATGKVLIDFGLMNDVSTVYVNDSNSVKKKTYLRVQPGARFECIKPVLDKAGLGIAHGTCQTVAIAGYTLGGGWGPWTRKYGMGCERLTGATIVLGDGSIRQLGNSQRLDQYQSGRPAVSGNDIDVDEGDDSQQDRRLLWALKGGGGLSYGIVTELDFEPFSLPEVALSFSIKRDDLPEFRNLKAVHVIKAWEELIAAGKHPKLIGTNLKVVAKGVESEEDISEDAVLDWQFNGHFGGSCEDLRIMLEEFAMVVACFIVYGDSHDCNLKKLRRMKRIENELIHYFDTICERSIHHKSIAKGSEKLPYALSFEHWDKHSKAFLSLEHDGPAPHKITSKMPTPQWLEESCGNEGRKALVKSLQSPLLKGDEQTSISAYITLGAISGEFYRQDNPHQDIAFPYADRPFTIQYQAWWNTTHYASVSPAEQQQICQSGNMDREVIVDDHVLQRMAATRAHENRAQDWIESCRNYNIPYTSGSFISFKDSSVPTPDYFGEHYQELVDIKTKYSQDKKCYLRSRKTII
nr:FAD-binding oxidoreductase [Salinisphaera sp. G21_0]